MREKIQIMCEYLDINLSSSEINEIIKLTHSDTALANNVKNDFPLSLFTNAVVTLSIAEYFLELGYKINSGYRNKTVNELVGGSENSRHMVFRALDIQLHSYDTSVVVNNMLRELSEIIKPIAYIDYYYRKGNMLHIQWTYV